MTTSQPELCLIAAMGRNRAIGRDNRLLWKLKGDMQFFRAQTLGHPVVMGRKTWESLGRPLPGRENRVITRNPAYQAEGATTYPSLEAALAAGSTTGKLFVIGGADIYAQTLPQADRLYLTHVDDAPEADAFFPELPPQLVEVQRTTHSADEHNQCHFAIVEYQRQG